MATIRFSQETWDKVGEEAKRYGMSQAEAVRRCVQYFLSEDRVLIPLNRQERRFIEELSESLGVDPSQAVRMVLLSFNVLMHSNLFNIVKPIDEILRELEAEKDEDEMRAEEVERAGSG